MDTQIKRVFKQSTLALLTVTMVTALLFPIPVSAEEIIPDAEPEVIQQDVIETPEPTAPAADSGDGGGDAGGETAGEDKEASAPEAASPVPEYQIPEGSAYIVGEDGEENTVFNNDGTSNAIQKAVDEALKSGKDSVTIVVKNGVYSGGVWSAAAS